MSDQPFDEHATKAEAVAEAFAEHAAKAEAAAYQEQAAQPQPTTHPLEEQPKPEATPYQQEPPKPEPQHMETEPAAPAIEPEPVVEKSPTDDHVPDQQLPAAPITVRHQPYQEQPPEPFDDQPTVQTAQDPYDQPANPPSPPTTLPTLSPSVPRRPAVRECIRPVCRATHTQQWGNSPDGQKTLCVNCYVLYSQLKLVLYQRPDGRLSVLNTPDSRPMRVVEFATRPTGNIPGKKPRRDLTKPSVVPLTDSPQDQALLAAQNVPPMRRGPHKKRKRTDAVRTSPRSVPGNYVMASQVGHPLDAEQVQVAPTMPVELKEGEGVYVKAEFNDDMRRFRIRRGASLAEFKREIHAVFGFKKDFLFSVTYQDEEKDFVRIASDRDMMELFHLVEVHSLKPIRVRLIS